MTQQPGFSTYGAVDLGALAARAQAAEAGGTRGPEADGGGSYSIDVTDASFQSEVIDLSMTVPVVIDLWAEWCGPCKQLSPILERLAEQDGGRWVLARVDVDANPALSQAFAVQSIPAVFAVIKGQPLPLFQGAIPEPQARQVIDELLRVAAENGLDGRVSLPGSEPAEPAADEQPVEPSLPPLIAEAYDAIDRGDLDAAAEAFRKAVAENPADDEATLGLSQVELMRRTRDIDDAAARAAADQAPDDVAAQTLVADLDVLRGDVDSAFARLVRTVGRTEGAERDRARQHLLELFDVVGSDDERVLRARRDLAAVLF
jgi:putative thioredoxin